MGERYLHGSLGTNLKPTDLAAAIGMAQLAATESGTSAGVGTRWICGGTRGYYMPAELAGREHVWHQFTMRFPGERQSVVDGLTSAGSARSIYYPVPSTASSTCRRCCPAPGARAAGDEPAG